MFIGDLRADEVPLMAVGKQLPAEMGVLFSVKPINVSSVDS